MSSGPIIGGIGDSKPADDIVKDIAQKIRNEVEEKAGVKYSEFTPIVFKTQLVNGVNYFIKIRVGEEQYIHIRTHKTFSGDKISFANFQDNKSIDEEINYF